MTLQTFHGTALVVLSLVVAGCSAEAPTTDTIPRAPQSSSPITQAEVERSLQEAVSALNAGDAANAATAYAPDAVFVNARGTFETQAGIEAFWAEALKAPNAGKDLKIALVKWGTSGNLAYSLGRFTGGITAGSGHVLAVSERQPDGSLKTVAQVSIPDPAPVR